MDNKLIITNMYNKILCAYFEDSKICELNFEDNSILGNIYVGRVQNVVKNIDAAFVEIQKDLVCYYSLKDNKHHIFLNKKNNESVNTGDLLLVQVEREDVKTKAPTVTCNINLSGKYSVLTYGKAHLGISNKIKNEHLKKLYKELAAPYVADDTGFIIRTNAKNADSQEVINEMAQLKEDFTNLRQKADYLNAFSILYKAPESYINSIRDLNNDTKWEIVTDDPDIFEKISNFLSDENCSNHTIRFYEDKALPLAKLYSLETHIKDALKKKVWLKSGAYLVIEVTEALTVIDVNTGKYDGKKKSGETFLRINMEAAREIALQMRLRNLSGIIIIDFIDLDKDEYKEALLEELKTVVKKDHIKTTVVDMTALNLVEVTRKKVKKPFHEQISIDKIFN